MLSKTKFLTELSSLCMRQTATISNALAVESELKQAKPFEAVPKQSWICRETLPGGILNGKPMDEWYPYFYAKHGNIIRFPGFLGRPPIVAVFEPEDMQKVYHNTAKNPYRLGLETWTYWRENKDLFKKFLGLVIE